MYRTNWTHKSIKLKKRERNIVTIDSCKNVTINAGVVQGVQSLMQVEGGE